MLKSMRKNMKVIMWVLLVTFILWGGSSAVLSRSKGADYAGIVFGKKVGLKEYEKNFNAVENQAKLMYGERFGELKQYLNLEQQAWDRIILLKDAASKHIRVSDKEVIETICGMPLFQDSGGKFVPQIYKRVVEYFLRVSAREFEEEIKDSVRIAKRRDDVIKNMGITDSELLEAYKIKNEKADVDYVLVNLEDYKAQVDVDDTKLSQFYEEHKEGFRMPVRVNIEYIAFEYSGYQKGVSIPDDETEKYYQAHKKDYDAQKGTPAEIKDRIKKMLLDKKAQDAAAEASSDASYELARAEHPDFTAVAKKFNLPVKETGFFAMDEPIPGIGLSYTVGFEAFKLERGQISHPIKSQTGRYIIRLKDKKGPYLPSLDEIRKEVKDVIVLEEAKKLSLKKAEELFAAIKQKMDSGTQFKQACSELKLDALSTGPFGRLDYIPLIGKSGNFVNAAFSTEQGKLAAAAGVPQGAAIIFVREKTPTDEERFKNEKEEFKKTALEEKRQAYFGHWFNTLKEKADLKIVRMPEEKTGQQKPAPPASGQIPFDDF